MSSQRIQQLRRVETIRFVLPFILFFIVALYETWEHILLKGEFYFDVHLTSEVLFFGVLGPLAVFTVLTYVVGLLRAHIKNAEALEKLNESLEQKVGKRTEEINLRNQQLAEANEELKKLDQLKSDFVSLVSHELRGPLTTLNGGIELALQSSNTMPVDSRRVLEVMAKETEDLTEFVQSILDVSRIEAGEFTVSPGPVALRPMLEHVIDLIFVDKSRDIQLKGGEENLLPVLADEIYLEKILCNLLSNAEKYSPEHTPIIIESRVLETEVQIVITNKGKGIPADQQEKIFDRFFRVGERDNLSNKSWGLGLYFAKELTELQGGELAVVSPVFESKNEPGTSFILTMPLVADEGDNDD